MGLHQASLPEVEVPRVPANARPNFEASEFNNLNQLSLSRLTDLKCNERVRRDRTILHCYIMIAAFSGMRPTEIKNLNWSDVLGYRLLRDGPIGERDITFRVRGKDKHRTFVALEAALPWLDLLWMFWTKAIGVDPGDTDPVFATPNEKRLRSVKKSLQELLRSAGLLTDHRGMRRTSNSFRHFYISQQLIAGVGIYALARNTGTSSDMIERFYADVRLEHITKELRPEWQTSKLVKSDPVPNGPRQ